MSLSLPPGPPTVPRLDARVQRAKVRDVYAPATDSPWAGRDVLLVVASDRISAYDHILATPIPDKGKVLTALSACGSSSSPTSSPTTSSVSTSPQLLPAARWCAVA